MGDFHLDSSFHRDLQQILDDVDLSIDERLERLIALLNELEPALLESAVKLTERGDRKGLPGVREPRRSASGRP